MTPVSGLIAHIRTHNCTHLAGLMRCPGHRRDEVCSQHSNGQGRSLFTPWLVPTPMHTRHALIHVLYTYSHVSMFEIWDAPGGLRCANGRQCRRSAGGEDVFNHCPVPGPRQHHSSILRIVRSLKYAHRCIPPTHIVRTPAHHTTIPPAWHYLATRPLTKYSFITVCTYVSLYIKSTQFNPHTLYPHSCVSISSHPVRLPLSLKRRSRRRFVITEKAPISLLLGPSSGWKQSAY